MFHLFQQALGHAMFTVRHDADWPSGARCFRTFWNHLQSENAEPESLERLVKHWNVLAPTMGVAPVSMPSPGWKKVRTSCEDDLSSESSSSEQEEEEDEELMLPSERDKLQQYKLERQTRRQSRQRKRQKKQECYSPEGPEWMKEIETNARYEYNVVWSTETKSLSRDVYSRKPLGFWFHPRDDMWVEENELEIVREVKQSGFGESLTSISRLLPKKELKRDDHRGFNLKESEDSIWYGGDLRLGGKLSKYTAYLTAERFGKLSVYQVACCALVFAELGHHVFRTSGFTLRKRYLIPEGDLVALASLLGSRAVENLGARQIERELRQCLPLACDGSVTRLVAEYTLMYQFVLT